MEEDLIVWKMEDDLNFLGKGKTTLILKATEREPYVFRQMQDDLTGRQPQFILNQS